MLLQLKDDPDSQRWIAAEFTDLPENFALGSGEAIGAYRNRALEARVEYRVFVAAYKTDEQVRTCLFSGVPLLYYMCAPFARKY